VDRIGDLNGGNARAAIDAAIAVAVADLHDRAQEDGKARKVQIDLELKMVNGLVTIDVQVHAKVPPYRTGSTVADVGFKNKQPVLVFQSFAPENPAQDTIYDDLEGNKE
jgi:hypothetical protein